MYNYLRKQNDSATLELMDGMEKQKQIQKQIIGISLSKGAKE